MTDQLDAQCPRIPDTLLPHDGRFGCGPSKIRTQQLDALMRPLIMGTSHRQQPVRSIVASIRSGLRDLFSLPEGWEVALGNGGSTTFWAVATTSLIRRRSAHAVFGEFGSKFADEAARAPHLAAPLIVKSEPGTVATLIDEGAVVHDSGEPIDVAAYPHHETSTGALSPLYRVNVDDCLTVVDATSIAGGVRVDLNNVDVYYFSPQKCFGSDGGLWVALLSPAAQERAERLHGDDARWMPQILDLSIACRNSSKDQTLNTPAIATLIMLDQQIQWMLAGGGLQVMEARCLESLDVLYQWADAHSHLTPFVSNAQWRSPVVVTVDCDDTVDAARVCRILRANGVVDVEPYRKLGRNQLRIGTFPSVESRDVRALTQCVDWVIDNTLA